MKYYLINEDNELSVVIPDDARQEYIDAANNLMLRNVPHTIIDGRKFIRAYGVIDGGKS